MQRPSAASPAGATFSAESWRRICGALEIDTTSTPAQALRALDEALKARAEPPTPPGMVLVTEQQYLEAVEASAAASGASEELHAQLREKVLDEYADRYPAGHRPAWVAAYDADPQGTTVTLSELPDFSWVAQFETDRAERRGEQEADSLEYRDFTWEV